MITEALIKQIDVGREGKNRGYSMGLPKLESIIDGVSANTYTLVFSPSGTGKSSLALYAFIYRPLMEHLNDDNFKVFYASLEMSADLLFAKLLCMYIFETYGIELSTKELLSKKKDYILNDELYNIVQECIPWMKKVEEKVTIYDKGMNAEILYSLLMADLQEIGTFSETDHRKIYTPNNPNLVYLVVIDHISLLRPNKNRSLKEEIDLVSSYLVTLRNICRISPLVIMQANRDSAGMERRKQGLNNMRLSDTKDSGGPKTVYFYMKSKIPLGPTINSVKQGNSLEDNPVLNPQEIEENAERLEVMPNEKDEAIKSSTKAGHCSK